MRALAVLAAIWVTACNGPEGAPIDAPAPDAAVVDGAEVDAPPIDAAPLDAPPIDAAIIDATPIDAAPLPPPTGDATTRLVVYPERAGRQFTVLYADSGGRVHLVYSASGWRHVDVTAAAGLASAAAEIFAMVPSDPAEDAASSLSIVVRGTDGSFTRIREEGAAWQRTDLSAATGAVPSTDSAAAFSIPGGAEVVLYRGVDGALHRLVRPAGTATFTDHLVAGAVLPAGPIASGAGGAGLYRGPDQRPVAFRIEPDGTITFRATFAGAMTGRGAAETIAAIDVVAWADPAGRLFRGDPATGAIRDVTATLGLAPIAGDLDAYVLNFFPYVLHRTTGGHIVQTLLYAAGESTLDATALAEGSLALGDPAGHQPSRFLEVHYVAADGHLHVIVRVVQRPPTGFVYWFDMDVTAEFGP